MEIESFIPYSDLSINLSKQLNYIIYSCTDRSINLINLNDKKKSY